MRSVNPVVGIALFTTEDTKNTEMFFERLSDERDGRGWVLGSLWPL